MDDATFTSDAASMNRRILLEQLMAIRSLMHKKGAADNDSRDVIKDLAKKGMTLKKEQLTALSTEFLLTVLLDLFLLRLLDEGATVSSDPQRLVDDAAAAKRKKRAAAKKKRYKRNKAAAKQQQKKTKLVSWLGGGIISVIMMVAFSFITTPIVTLSLFQPSDGLGEGKAPPALPPSASKSLRQEDLKPDNEASTSPDIIISPLAAVVPPPVFAPTAVSNRRMKFDAMRASTCLDTPNWKDVDGYGCDYYEEWEHECPNADRWAGDMGPATKHCCICGGGSHTLPPTNSPTITNSPSISANPSSSSKPSNSPTKSTNPTQFCLDTPNWKDAGGYGCDYYEEHDEEGCPIHGSYAGDMGPASENCCYCGGWIRTCEDFRSICQQYINVLDLGFDESGFVAPFCKEAESCSCEGDGDADYYVTVVDYTYTSWDYTDGLYNECKCDFWSRLCVDTRVGEACDYAAEYCCGDYFYDGYGFHYLNSPTCYCDFFNYAQDEFGHKLKPKALNISKEFENPCGQIQDFVDEAVLDYRLEVERPGLEAIYIETSGQNWTDNGGWMKETVDHCEWHGISCDSDGFVTGIDLRDNNLAGQFPVYTRNTIDGEPIPERYWMLTKYGLANLYNLKTIDLADNKLTGTIEYPPLYNLHSLTHFDVSGNQLSGELDALVTSSLTYADFHNNKFTSLLSFKKYKQSFQSLRFCDVSNNTIQKDATELFENIPPNIEQFFASNSQIYGILPMSLNNLPKLRQFNISSNALSGSLPLFADSFLSLQELDLSNQNQKNGFIGSIPEDLWRLQSLKVLNLAGNTLAGTISPDIGKMAALEEFDLSNNLLSGQIPTQMGQLEGE
ncbi:leucine-rich repeat domain-containing protein [Skeletonema marinoi]|uniref:Leucine-rich repeat domain-containing protein n=1 Tax=Skeletonema marinoi TaxID=267567 RepID=A0AAD8YD65_9STRA|nr:leucine-rich repeat domain-containing protein [Skeletonema marinoi]